MKPEDCSKLHTCFKIEIIRDKDMLDFQYADAIRDVCARCDQGEVISMKECSKCGAAMLRGDLYDPAIPLYGGIRDEKGLWWVCINPVCEDGQRNAAISGSEIVGG